MKLQAELYIDVSGDPTSDTPVYRRLDLFDFEEIELTSSVQDVRDIEKVFTDYSRQFTLPASRVNNNIFNHYYNTNILNGFDARIKQRAYININGITFREGYLRLSEVVRRNGQPSSYKVVFFGSMVNLSQVVGELKLSSLSGLSKYNHDYDIDTVYNGFVTGLGISGSSMVTSSNRDIIYPAISALDKWFYDSSGATSPSSLQFAQGNSTNLYDPDALGGFGINYLHLKPAIKVIHVIEAIEERFSSISFSRDFFGRSFFNELYLLLHNTKGLLSPTNSQQETISLTYRVGSGVSDSDFTYVSGEPDQRLMVTRWENFGPLKVDVQQYDVIATVTPVSPASGSRYTLKILDGDDVLGISEDLSGTQSLTITLCTENETTHPDIKVVVETRSTTELTTFDLGLELKKVRYRVGRFDVPDLCTASVPEDTFSSFYDVSGTITTLSTIDVAQHVPDITISDFLKGLFRMFNLTSEVNNSGTIVVKTLNTYYDDGNEIDITGYVHTDEDTLSRVKLFDNINFKFAEPKTFGVKNQNEILQDNFGNLEFQTSPDGTERNLAFDGGKYEIKLPFEKLFYERLRDENDLTIATDFGNGWLADDNQSPVLTKPVLFFNVNQTVDTGSFDIGFLNKSGNIANYNRPSNSTSDESYTLHFGGEFDEYSGNSLTRSLFSLFYKGYIANLFNKNSRIFSVNAHLPLDFLVAYGLNDTLVIRDKYYLINRIKTDLTTGYSQLELMTEYEEVEETPATDITAPSVPTNITQGLTDNSSIGVTWDASTDNVGVTGYKVYVDGVLTQTLGVTTQTTLTGLSANTTYVVTVSAFDEAGNNSDESTDVDMTTANFPDITAPSVPPNLTATAVTSDSVSLSWGASSDNVAVQGYRVYTDGASPIDVGNVLTYTVTGLTSVTSYDFNVTAYDNAGSNVGFGSGDNESALSNTVIGTTTEPVIE